MVVRRNRATHWLPTTGTLFGCGPNASQSTLLSATPEVLSTSREGASGSTNHGPALGEISGHWDAVYEAMRREDESQQAAEH